MTGTLANSVDPGEMLFMVAFNHRVHILIIILMTGTLANSVDPDEMLYMVAFNQGPQGC